MWMHDNKVSVQDFLLKGICYSLFGNGVMYTVGAKLSVGP